MRPPDDAREAAYHAAPAAAGWQVVACKPADVYDNLADGVGLPAAFLQRGADRAAANPDLFRPRPPVLPGPVRAGFAAVERKPAEARARPAG